MYEKSSSFNINFYGISGFLDAFDGYAARKYNQGTRFGAVLDMVTDRCATSSLIVYIGVLYPQYTVMWQILVSLDLASHYMHMYAMLSAGSTSHKMLMKLNQNYYLYIIQIEPFCLLFVLSMNYFTWLFTCITMVTSGWVL